MYCMLAPPFPKVKCKTPCSLQSVRWFLRWSPVALHIALRGYSQKTKYLRQGGVEPKLGKKEEEKYKARFVNMNILCLLPRATSCK